MADADELDAVAALTAQLAVTALHEADMHQAELLSRRLDTLMRDRTQNTTQNVDENTPNSIPANASETAGKISSAIGRHAELVRAAVTAAQHPLGDSSELTTVLRDSPASPPAPAYQPLLVLLLAELTVADATVAPFNQAVVSEAGSGTAAAGTPPVVARLAELDELIISALIQLADTPDKEVALRLQLVRACYDSEERRNLLTLARQLRLPRTQAALVLAAQARRDALDGSADEALEHWRQAVGHAIHEGRTNDASGGYTRSEL